VLRELKGPHRVYREHRVLQDHKVFKVHKVRFKGCKGHKEHRDH
jgi:hypothetical protein